MKWVVEGSATYLTSQLLLAQGRISAREYDAQLAGFKQADFGDRTLAGSTNRPIAYQRGMLILHRFAGPHVTNRSVEELVGSVNRLTRDRSRRGKFTTRSFKHWAADGTESNASTVREALIAASNPQVEYLRGPIDLPPWARITVAVLGMPFIRLVAGIILIGELYQWQRRARAHLSEGEGERGQPDVPTTEGVMWRPMMTERQGQVGLAEVALGLGALGYAVAVAWLAPDLATGTPGETVAGPGPSLVFFAAILCQAYACYAAGWDRSLTYLRVAVGGGAPLIAALVSMLMLGRVDGGPWTLAVSSLGGRLLVSVTVSAVYTMLLVAVGLVVRAAYSLLVADDDPPLDEPKL
jgi:hypothetical protein